MNKSKLKAALKIFLTAIFFLITWFVLLIFDLHISSPWLWLVAGGFVAGVVLIAVKTKRVYTWILLGLTVLLLVVAIIDGKRNFCYDYTIENIQQPAAGETSFIKQVGACEREYNLLEMMVVIFTENWGEPVPFVKFSE